MKIGAQPVNVAPRVGITQALIVAQLIGDKPTISIEEKKIIGKFMRLTLYRFSG